MATLTDLHIVGLEVENVMRVRVVRLAPGPGLVEIAGNNKQGKTSLLDAISMALGGKDAIPWAPVRVGQEKATIRVDLGNGQGLALRVTRKFTHTPDKSPPYTTTLKLELADGARPQGEQTLLNSLVRGLSFDPQAFMDAKPFDRVVILKGLVPEFDFDANERARKKAYDDRTALGRDVKRVQGVVDSLAVPLDTPNEPIDIVPLVEKLERLGDVRAEYESVKAAYARERLWIDQEAATLIALGEKVAQLRREADAIEAQVKGRQALHVTRITAFGNALPLQPPDAEAGAELQKQIGRASAINEQVRDLKRLRSAEKELEDTKAKVVSLGKDIENFDRMAVEAIERADLPSGLKIEDAQVMLRGVPFDQGSTAEQLRMSIGIGMHLNPDLKVMRIRQGSALDDEAWAIIKEVALEEGYQIWAETIHAHGPEAIIMQEGEVKT